MSDAGAPFALSSRPSASRPAISRARFLLSAPVLVPLATFLAAAAVVLVIAALGQRAATLSDRVRFEVIAGDIVARLVDGIATQITVLDGVGALHNVDPGAFDAERFAAYLRELTLRHTYPGVTSIGFARRTSAATQDDRQALISRMYDTPVRIVPRIGPGDGYPVTLLETVGGLPRSALGFDLGSEPRRFAAMMLAADTARPAATGPVNLLAAPGEPRPLGFVVFRPVYTRGAPPLDIDARRSRLAGFAFAPIRAADFFGEVLDGAPLGYAAVEILDVQGEPAVLYRSDPTPSEGRQLHVAPLDVAGHAYEVRITSKPAYDGRNSARFVVPIAGLGILFAAAAGALVRQRMLVRLAEREERTAALEAARDKDLLLQEMKHRIKNAFARVQAVARQTARSSTTIEEFLGAFEARLAAMSATHDLLTRSRWEGADLAEVVAAEIEPVLGPRGDAITVEGPAVHLDARQVLAIGLTVHELATNAVKYGAVTRSGGRLAIHWRVERGEVVLTWTERRAPGAPSVAATGGHRGFGSRLIDTTVSRELGGAFERTFEPEGLSCRLTFPLPVR